jgi:hypothetical protein
MDTNLDIKSAVKGLNKAIRDADASFDRYILDQDVWSDLDWAFETCYLKLLAIVEAMHLNELHKKIYSEYLELKSDKNGFNKVVTDPNGEPYAAIGAKLRQYLYTINQFFPSDDDTTVTKDLVQIIKDSIYSITDTTVFNSVPRNEKDIHLRIETILKCMFSDLKHKPTLTKTIKNFEPDTGIPSIKTLIEYKYLDKKDDDKLVADQILADTRGYSSNEWKHVIFVIYETHRFRKEKEWNLFLRDSGIPENTSVIVLSGESK